MVDFPDSLSRVPDFGLFLEKLINPFENRQIRVPFYFTSTYRQYLDKPGVSMLVNPSNISFTQNKRITEVETQGGRVFYHWTNERGRNNDILRLEFSGQTGNIDLRNGTVQAGAVGNFGGSNAPFIDTFNDFATSANSDNQNPASVALRSGGYTASGASKLSNFHNLWSLTREPIRNPDNNARVYYFAIISSPLFGNTFITFVGHFSRVLNVTEDANNPYSKQYSFGFNVEASVPDFDTLYNEVANNLSSTFLNPIG